VTKIFEEGYRGGGAFGPKGKNVIRRQRKLLDEGGFNYFLSGNVIRIINFF
jgi:hypothetical protein